MPAHRISRFPNGQVSLHADAVAIHAVVPGHGFYRNDGRYDVVPHGDLAVAAAAIRAAFPEARVTVRTLTNHGRTRPTVSIRPSVAMLADVAALDAEWQVMAARGDSHRAMVDVVINHPTYLRLAA